MAIRYHALSVIILLLVGTAAPQAPGEPGGPTAGSGLTGQVVDASGMGISGARVWIIGGEGQAINTTTNTTGYYGLNLPPGNYTVTAELPGYSFTSSTAQVQAGTVTIAQRITGYAAGAAPIAGTVPVAGALPVAGAVPAAPTTPTMPTVPSVPSAPVVTTTPVANATPIAGTAPVTIAPTGFYQYGLPYPSAGPGWVEGRIVDQSGGGIPFASIRVDGFPISATTDEQGNYRIELPPGMHTIDAARSGYGIPPRVVFIFPGQTSTLYIIAKRTVALGSVGRV